MTRNPNIQFMCRSCKKPVFRLGKSVNKSDQLCGRCNTFDRTDPAPKLPQKRTEQAVETTNSLESHAIQDSNRQSVAYFRKKLDLVEQFLASHPDAGFHELWTMAERKLNP